MKIIQIAVSTINESGDDKLSSYNEIYGLSDTGELYEWGRRRTHNPVIGEIDPETGKPINFIWAYGWKLQKNELDK